MTTYGHNWAYNEADKRAKHKCRCGQCIRCLGKEAYVAETARLKAEHDERGYEKAPPRGYWMKLRQAR